jgi:signal transduction histidine kinase
MEIKQPRILVIDDEHAVCNSCSEVFKRDRYMVETAFEGVSGLKKFEEFKPDVVFLDLKMPGMNGLEVLEKIVEKDKNAVAIVITGYATIESAVESIKKGAFDFLPKPFTPAELRIITKRGLEKKRLIREAEALRRDKESMREKFIAMVSHQLKTPLVAVQEYFEVMLSGIVGPVTEEQRKMIERVQSRTGDLLKLIDEWLSYASIEGNRIAQRFVEFDVEPLVREVVEFLEPGAAKRNIRLEIQSTGSLLLKAERDLLREAFINLVHNAIQYNRDAGHVTITLQKESNKLVAKVSDTGIGIHEEDLPHLFEEFFRGKDVTGIPGTGLGLPLVKRIVEAHGGSISVESRVGEGTTFVLNIPAGNG